MIAFGYSVIEHYEDEGPEPFGFYFGTPDVKPGDVIQLKWLDGRDAYRVKVSSRDGMTLHVKSETSA